MLIIKLQIVTHKEIVKLSRDNHYQAEECYLVIVIKVPPKRWYYICAQAYIMSLGILILE